MDDLRGQFGVPVEENLTAAVVRVPAHNSVQAHNGVGPQHKFFSGPLIVDELSLLVKGEVCLLSEILGGQVVTVLFFELVDLLDGFLNLVVQLFLHCVFQDVGSGGCLHLGGSFSFLLVKPELLL